MSKDKTSKSQYQRKQYGQSIDKYQGYITVLITIVVLFLLTVFVEVWRAKNRDNKQASYIKLSLNEFDNFMGQYFNVQNKTKNLSLGHYVEKNYKEDETIKIGLVATTRESVDNIMQWIAYHKILGVHSFYLFLEGETSEQKSAQKLREIQNVRVFTQDKKLNYYYHNSRSHADGLLLPFINKLCNYQLFIRQQLNQEVASYQAQQDKLSWIMHLDTDELIYLEQPDQKLSNYFKVLNNELDSIILTNYESVGEHNFVQRPFNEITLFKRNPSKIDKLIYDRFYELATNRNPTYLHSYANGKAVARVQPNLRPNGAHRWETYEKRRFREVESSKAYVLHYTLTMLRDMLDRKKRCAEDCKATLPDAENCFILPFDQQIFVYASTKSEKQLMDYFVRHVLITDTKVTDQLISAGILQRIITPSIIVRILQSLPSYGLVIGQPPQHNILDHLVPTQQNLQEEGYINYTMSFQH